MSFPSLPGSVDRHLRQIINTMLGRTGNAGDRVMTYSDAEKIGLLSADPGTLNYPAKPGSSITDILKPVKPGEVASKPTTPKGLATTGVWGAIILEWEPAGYKGHSHTEVYRAQMDDVTQAQMVHEEPASIYSDIVDVTDINWFYWIRHVNRDGLKSQYNQVAGTVGRSSEDQQTILKKIQGEIDDSYFTAGWAQHTEQQESALQQAEQDIQSAGQAIDEANERLNQASTAQAQSITLLQTTDGEHDSKITTLEQTTATQSQKLSQLESTDGAHSSKISELEQTTATQASKLSQLESTDGEQSSKISTLEQTSATQSLAIAALETIDGEQGSKITTLEQTTANQSQKISDLETVDGEHSGKITSLEQTTADQATAISNLTTTTGENTASINEQKTVTDGLKAEYTLKTSQTGPDGKPVIAAIGVASGQSEDGETFSEIAFAADGFFFASANGLHNPFAMVNIGTDESPEYQIAMDADVQLNGAMSINQLKSGELQNGAALTVGNGSLEISTASDGTGQLVISGDGGIANNDYTVINAGRLSSWVHVPGTGHVPYKEVKRMETGTANSGQQVKVPAYFKSQPTIHLYPRDISIYNASYPTQSQRLEIWHTPPAPHPTEAGAWLFTPYARLVLAAGSETVSANWAYSGTSSDQYAYLYGVNNLQAVTVYGRFASSRHTGSGNTYQNRKVTMYLYYRVPGGSWALGSSATVNVNQFSTHSLSLSKSLSLNTYDIRVRFLSSDRSGTFTNGTLQYDYTTQDNTGSNYNYENEHTSSSTLRKSKTLYVSKPSMSGWELTRVDYTFKADITLRARTLYQYSNSSDVSKKKKGYAEVKLPNGSSSKTYRFDSPDSNIIGGYPWREKVYTNETFTKTDTSSLSGSIYPSISIKANGTGYAYKTYSGIASSYVKLNVKEVKATFHYRKPVTASASAINQFYFDSASYNRGATDISLSNAVVTWTAISSE